MAPAHAVWQLGQSPVFTWARGGVLDSGSGGLQSSLTAPLGDAAGRTRTSRFSSGIEAGLGAAVLIVFSEVVQRPR